MILQLKQKGDFNVNNFIYGLSAYIGYKETSLYVKYDLNPIFENNRSETKQHFIRSSI